MAFLYSARGNFMYQAPIGHWSTHKIRWPQAIFRRTGRNTMAGVGPVAGAPSNTAAPSLDSLDDPTLQNIALLVDSQQRRCGLPLISRRWSRLLRCPSAAWETLAVDVDAELPEDVQPNEAAMISWYQQRMGAVQILSFRGDTVEPRLSAGLATAIIMTQCSSLRSLEICVPACGVSGSNLGVVAACTRLTSLKVTLKRGCSWSDHSSGLLSSISHFPALQELSLGTRSGVPFGALPASGHFSRLHSATLTCLSSMVGSAEGGPLQLAGLPALRDLQIIVVAELEQPLAITASTFAAVRSLTSIFLSSSTATGVQLHPDSLRPLTALQKLMLPGCNLAEFPPALAAVGQTLRSLDIRGNWLLQLTAAAHDILLGMPRLHTLRMQKDSEAAMWTDESMKRMMSLLSARRSRYPRRVALHIVWND